MIHVLVGCGWTQGVWKITKFWEISAHNSNYDLWGLFKYAKHVLTNDELSLFVLTSWGIWEARNKCLYENVKMVPSHVVDRIEGIFQS